MIKSDLQTKILRQYSCTERAECMYVCMYVGMHVCMYVCMYVCMCVCMYAFMYICVYEEFITYKTYSVRFKFDGYISEFRMVSVFLILRLQNYFLYVDQQCM
jgi:hypothetical protein